MATFVLTARGHMTNGTTGMYIPKGHQMTITIPMIGITPNNLFGNSRCKDLLLQQFAVNGISLAPNSPWLNRGYWDIRMIGK